MEGRRDHQKRSRRQQTPSLSRASHNHRPPNHKNDSRAAEYDLSTRIRQLGALARYTRHDYARRMQSCEAMMLLSARRSFHSRHQAARILTWSMFYMEGDEETCVVCGGLVDGSDERSDRSLPEMLPRASRRPAIGDKRLLNRRVGGDDTQTLK